MGHGGGGETYAGTTNARPLTLDSSAGVIGRGDAILALDRDPRTRVLRTRLPASHVYAFSRIDLSIAIYLFFSLFFPFPFHEGFKGARVPHRFQAFRSIFKKLKFSKILARDGFKFIIGKCSGTDRDRKKLVSRKGKKGEKLSYNSRDRRGEILESGGESRNRLRFPMPPTG